MDFRRSLLLLIVALSSLLLRTTAIPDAPKMAQPPPIPAALSILCKGAMNPELCARSILPSLKDPFDPLQALLIEVNVTGRYTKRVLGLINGLMAKPNSPSCLNVCKEVYESILDDVQKALELIPKKNMYDSRIHISAVITFQDTCEDCFKESPGKVFAFSRQSKTIGQLASNCLAIMEALEGKS